MHQGKCQAGMENIPSEKKSLFCSSFLPPFLFPPLHRSFMSMDVFLVIVIHKMIMDLVIGRQKFDKDFLAWRSFPVTFLDAIYPKEYLQE